MMLLFHFETHSAVPCERKRCHYGMKGVAIEWEILYRNRDITRPSMTTAPVDNRFHVGNVMRCHRSTAIETHLKTPILRLSDGSGFFLNDVRF
jgi:hypothetical protein